MLIKQASLFVALPKKISASKIVPTKDPIKPKVDMKRIHWKRCLNNPNANADENVWTEMIDREIKHDELETLFCMRKPKKPTANPAQTTDAGAEEAKTPKRRETVQLVEVFDPK